MKPTKDQKIMLKLLGLGMVVSLAACTSAYPPRDTSSLERINDQLKEAAVRTPKAAEPAVAVVPPAVSSSLLPPVRPLMPKTSKTQLEQRFDLVVADAPINQVLMGIVADTSYSIMVKPKSATPSAPGATPSAPGAAVAVTGLTDRVTINLKNVTMFEALDAIREVYGYDYTIEGNRIYVQQPELQTRLYQVNYIIGQRRGVSDLQVIGGASVGSSSGSSSSGSSGSGSSGGGSSGGGASGSFSSVQASAVSNFSKSDLWGEVEDTLRTMLGCQIPRNLPSGAGGAASASSGGAGRADVSFRGDAQAGERQRGVDGCVEGRAMSVNQMSGTILVRGMPNEQLMVAQMLRSMQVNIARQVIIEAKIIEVQLNSGAQQGINWASFNNNLHGSSLGANTTTIGSGSTVKAGTSLGELLGATLLGAPTGNAFTAGLGLAVQFRNFSALINFLQTQGTVQVLSSPRIATLNNQKAVLKVGSEEPFVSNASGGSITAATASGPGTTSNPTITYQPFFSGISLDVTPQIDDKDNITLHVHTMVNSISVKNKLAIIGATPGADRNLPFAVNTINQTDSVVKTRDGQVVVIGGLMTESAADNRSKIPIVDDVPGVGALTSNSGQSLVKRELVILLKPTVVKDDSAWANDITATQGRIEGFRPPPAPAPASQ